MYFVAAHDLLAACDVAGLVLVNRFPAAAAALPARRDEPDRPMVVLMAAAGFDDRAPDLGGTAGFVLASGEDDDTLRLRGSLLARLGDAIPDALIRTGRLVLGDTTTAFMLVCRAGPAAERLCDALASFDPKHRPHLIATALDLVLPWHGANVYPCELHRGYYLRWQGPDPVMRLSLADRLGLLTRHGNALIRIDIGLSLGVHPMMLRRVRTYFAGEPLPAVIAPQAGIHIVTAYLTPECQSRLREPGVDPVLELALPLALKGMPEGVEDTGRTFTFALSSVQLTAFFTRTYLPPLGDDVVPTPAAGEGDGVEGRPSSHAPQDLHATQAVHAPQAMDANDEIASAVAELEPRLQSVGDSGRLRAIYSDRDVRDGAARATALNAMLDGSFYHRLQLTHEDGVRVLVVDHPERRVTAAGFAYLAATPTRRLPLDRAMPVELRAAADALVSWLDAP